MQRSSVEKVYWGFADLLAGVYSRVSTQKPKILNFPNAALVFFNLGGEVDGRLAGDSGWIF
jgi:hypothetical protein